MYFFLWFFFFFPCCTYLIYGMLAQDSGLLQRAPRHCHRQGWPCGALSPSAPHQPGQVGGRQPARVSCQSQPFHFNHAIHPLKCGTFPSQALKSLSFTFSFTDIVMGFTHQKQDKKNKNPPGGFHCLRILLLFVLSVQSGLCCPLHFFLVK